MNNIEFEIIEEEIKLPKRRKGGFKHDGSVHYSGIKNQIKHLYLVLKYNKIM
jgi:hypothetical protein